MLYCLDSNAVSDILRQSYSVEQNMEDALQKRHKVAICPIVYYEIVRGLRIVNSKRKMNEFFKLYKETFVKLEFNYQAAKKAAEIYDQLHRGQQIEDNDIYIAAVAIVNDCTLITANDKHFSRIAGLKVENWR